MSSDVAESKPGWKGSKQTFPFSGFIVEHIVFLFVVPLCSAGPVCFP